MDEKSTAAPPAPAKESPRADADKQPPAAPQPKKLSADEFVTKHLADVADLAPEDHPEQHQLVSEFVEGLPSWQRRAVLTRFFAHGLRLESRIHPEVFKAALDEALNGRL